MKVKKIICIIFFIILWAVLMTSFNIVRAENELGDIPEKYDLRDYIDITVKNQGTNDVCVPTSQSTVLETYFKMKKLTGEINTDYDKLEFSMLAKDKIIQIDEANEVIKNFYKGTDKEYIENEDDLLKLTDENKNKDLRLEMEKIVPKYQLIGSYDAPDRWLNFKAILKEKYNDKIIYRNSNMEEMSLDEMTTIRNEYKQHIMENGAIRATINSQSIKSSELNGEIKVCNSKEKILDHSVAIIGWDDNFSKLNFPESDRPINDGAYIVQNSWGKSWSDNGIFYISYEDVNVENNPDGILGISKSNFEESDKDAPKIDIEESDSNVILRVSDQNGIGLDYFKYMYVDLAVNPDIDDSNWIIIRDSNKVVLDKEDKKNIWVYAVDKNGNAVKNVNGNTIYNDQYIASKYYISYSQEEDGIAVLQVKAMEGSLDHEIKLKCTTISDDDFEKNHIIDGNIYKCNISKLGTHVINVYEVIDGKEVWAGFTTVTVEEIAPCNKDIEPEITILEVVGINGLEDRAKIIIESEEKPYKIKSIMLMNLKTGLDIIIENPIDGKAEFEITENGKYGIEITNSIGNSTATIVRIDDISKYYLKDKTKPELVNFEVTKIEGANNKVNVTIEARDLESGIKNIGLEYRGDVSKKDPVDGKAQFEVTDSGVYYIVIENKAGLRIIKELNISADLFKKNEDKKEDVEYLYKIIEGENQTYNNSNLKIILDAPVEELISVTINNNKLNESNYTVEKGSTIITLKKEYLDTLKPGKYILVANYGNGKSVETSFIIPKTEGEKDENNDTMPEEKDENNDVPSEGEDKREDTKVDENSIGEDNTVANKSIPQTGVFPKAILVMVSVIGICVYITHRKYRKIIIK